MALWRLYYHLIWATKERQPLIAPTIETDLYNYIIGKSDSLGCIVHAVNGVADHIHLVVSIPPTLSIAEFVKVIKGSSSHYLNHDLAKSDDKFGWQAGYGVFSCGRKQLEQAVTYVRDQKTHHTQNTTIAPLEQLSHENNPPERLCSN